MDNNRRNLQLAELRSRLDALSVEAVHQFGEGSAAHGLAQDLSAALEEITALESAHEALGVALSAERVDEQRGRAAEEDDPLRRENHDLNQLLSILFETSPVGFAVISGVELRYAWINPAFRAMLAEHQHPPPGSAMRDFPPPGEAQQVQDVVRGVIISRQAAFSEQNARVYPNGAKVYFSYRVLPLDWESQPAALVILWNTTELARTYQKMEQYLIEAQRRTAEVEESHRILNALMAYVPEGIAIFDTLTRPPLMISQYGMQLAAQPHLSETPGGLGWKVYRPDGVTPVADDEMALTLAAQTGEVLENVEYVVEGPDGERVPILMNAGPIRDSSGRVTGVVAVWHDISERKLARAALELSESRFRLSNRAVVGIVYDWDLSPGQTFRSEGLERTIGVRAEDAPPENDWWIQRIHPDDLARIRPVVEEIFASDGDLYEIEYRVRHEDGRWVYVWDRAYILRDAVGQVVRVLGTATDITARKQAEQNAQFLAGLGERLLGMEDPQDMVNYFVSAVGSYLGVERCFLAEIDLDKRFFRIEHNYHNGQPEIAGTYPLPSIHPQRMEQYRRGESWAVSDIRRDPSTQLHRELLESFGIIACAGIPRIRDEQWVQALLVSASQPRVWREDEITLLAQAGGLAWLALDKAHLLRSLKETQALFDVALRNSEISVYTTDAERRYTWVYNMKVDISPADVIGLRDEDLTGVYSCEEIIQLKQSVLETGNPAHKEVRVQVGDKPVYLDMTVEPLLGAEGEVTGLLVAVIDMTHRRRIEAQVRETTSHIAIQRQILKHREDERQQIARDLHDGPIQDLMGLLFSVQAAHAICQSPDVCQILNEVRDEVQKMVGGLRSMCNELRPPTLVQFGLMKAIRSHAEDFQQRQPNLKIDLSLLEDGKMLPDGMRLALYRIYQEGMNNIARHAQATQAEVELYLEPGLLVLEIRDNGQGFEVPQDWVELAR